MSDAGDVGENLAQGNAAMMFTSSDEGRDGFSKIERVDFIEREFVVHEGAEQERIGTRTGAEWFEREGANTAFAQVRQEQACQKRFTNTGVGAGDEDEAHEKRTSKFQEPTSRRILRSRPAFMGRKAYWPFL